MSTDPITHHFGGGVYIKESLVPAGAVLVQHKHAHDHLSYLVSGSVLVLVDGEMRRLDAPACLKIVAGKHHGVRALTAATWLCIHATDCTDARDVDEVLIQPSDEDLHAMARSML
ncbi:cupin domain-containing protein [Variovorax sp. PBL-E5]|uniref:cupin domain-containing protein n=1 Tax=Variovorax sp. PBL-E5 TaxID=434014 RepID=UPI001316423C|nr:cupin domain-containing protein [Variovorax sp. PBL-E5]VTU37011.1 Cupin domain protein [Variovorax sp. PBL-E5]